jgi:Icc-related predicted phosphoesterase
MRRRLHLDWRRTGSRNLLGHKVFKAPCRYFSMTRVLLLADFHGQYGKLDSFLALEPDLVIISGDITQFGPSEDAVEVLSRIDVPCFAIPGNCDPEDLVDSLEESDAVCLHGITFTLGKITLTGIGGSNPTPFGTPCELSEEEIGALLEGATERMEKNTHNILVCHAPPHGTLDRIGDARVGSTALRKQMKRFDLVCCAHIHEAKGVMEEDGVKVVNPGPASEGHCALITLGDESRDIRIELLTV